MAIIGIDEVGRGSLAGPVVLAGVYLDSSYPIETKFYTQNAWYKDNPEFAGVRDSKKLSLPKRLKISDLVLKSDVKHLLLSASNDLIDEFGIGVCLSYLLLFNLYILTQNQSLKRIIVDGKIKILTKIDPFLTQKIITENNLQLDLNKFTDFVNVQKLPIIRENFADDKYLAVSLASNLAKVYRDNLMDELSKVFPEFDWHKNKGYGSQFHRQAIFNCNGKNQHLRQSFLSRVLKTDSKKF